MIEKGKIGASAILVLLVLVAGCVSGGPRDTATSQDPETLTPTVTTQEIPGTHTQVGTRRASEQPDSGKEIALENRVNTSADIRVHIIRETTNETVYTDSHTLDPGESRTVYNLSEADPTGIESFTVAVTAQSTTERITIQTNNCYGDAYAEIQTDGSLFLYYEIC